MTRVLLTGGGTAGHVAPALAVIAELRRRDPAIELLYVGSAQGVEARLVAEAGVPFRSVRVGKMRRSSKGLRGVITGANARDLLQIPVGIVQAFRAVRQFRPDVVLGTGGYVCVPTIIAAGLAKVPVLTHEQTTTIGLANRIAGRFAARIALTFEGSREELPKRLRSRAFVTGNPLRAEIFGGDNKRAADHFGFEAAESSPATTQLIGVYVTGGSQGSRKVNHAVRDCLVELLQRCQVLHQCGSADISEMTSVLEGLPDEIRGRYVVRQYIERDEIGDAYAFADVVVGRSGAGTVCELAALQKPSVLIPLEPSSKDEQLRNATRLCDAGGAVTVRQSQLSGQTLLAALSPFITSTELRTTMGARLAPLATPHATRDLVDSVVALAKQR